MTATGVVEIAWRVVGATPRMLATLSYDFGRQPKPGEEARIGFPLGEPRREGDVFRYTWDPSERVAGDYHLKLVLAAPEDGVAEIVYSVAPGWVTVRGRADLRWRVITRDDEVRPGAPVEFEAILENVGTGPGEEARVALSLPSAARVAEASVSTPAAPKLRRVEPEPRGDWRVVDLGPVERGVSSVRFRILAPPTPGELPLEVRVRAGERDWPGAPPEPWTRRVRVVAPNPVSAEAKRAEPELRGEPTTTRAAPRESKREAPAQPDLVVERSPLREDPAGSGYLRYTLTVRNAGAAAASGVEVNAWMNDTAFFREARPTRGEARVSRADGARIDWWIGRLAPGEGVSAEFALTEDQRGDWLTTTHTVVSAEEDANPTNNHRIDRERRE